MTKNPLIAVIIILIATLAYVHFHKKKIILITCEEEKLRSLDTLRVMIRTIQSKKFLTKEDSVSLKKDERYFELIFSTPCPETKIPKKK